MFEKIKDRGHKVVKHVKDNAILYAGGITLGITSWNYLKTRDEYKKYVQVSEWAVNEAYLTGVSDGVENVQKRLDDPEFMNGLNKELIGVRYTNENDTFINSIVNMENGVLITPATTVEFKDREEG